MFRPSLGRGGADRVTTTLLRHLDRSRFELELALVKIEGPFVQDVPSDVRVHDLKVPRLALAVPPLMQLIRARRPDVVFSTASAANPIASLAHALARSPARLVLSERNAFFRGRPRDIKQHIEVLLKRVTYGRAATVTAVSQGVADQLVSALNLPSSRVHVVFNPMVEDDLARRAAEPIEHPWFEPGQPPVVIACARLVEQKDYPTLLDAFARVHQATGARLFVLGEGPLRETLEAKARALGLGDAVCLYGFDKNPFKFMSRARVLMHSSRAEGLPGALIQAMACGTPVVSTDCDFGPREVIARSGTDGFLVPVGNANQLAHHAIQLLADDGLHARVAAAARESAQRFTVAASLARYTAALEA